MGPSLMPSYTQLSDPSSFICNQTQKARHPKVKDGSRNSCFPDNRHRLFSKTSWVLDVVSTTPLRNEIIYHNLFHLSDIGF